MLTDEQKRALDASIPREQIHVKPGKGGLSYVAGGWVTDQLNRILGCDGWSLEVVDVSVLSAEPIVAMARVRLVVHEPGDPSRPLCVREDAAAGTGHGADGYHQAIGEAVTDAMKRAAARLGRYLGGQLYLKDSDARSAPDLAPDVVQHGPGRGRPLAKAPDEWLAKYTAKWRDKMSPEHREWCECELARREAKKED